MKARSFVTGSKLVLLVFFACVTMSSQGVAQEEPEPETQVSSSSFAYAADLLAELKAGEPVEEFNKTIFGELDLKGREVGVPFRCHECVFKGDVLASDAIFSRIVDISGARFLGEMDFRGAVFHGAFLMRTSFLHPPETRDSEVLGMSRFALATFNNRAVFDDTVFHDRAFFTGTRFLGDVSFADTNFARNAVFDQADFGGTAVFTGGVADQHVLDDAGECPGQDGVFGYQAKFTRATFAGDADFRLRCFANAAVFQKARFDGEADFTLSSFKAAAGFNGVRFAELGSFVSADFLRTANFEEARSSSIRFDNARFGTKMTLSRLSATDRMSFIGVSSAGELLVEGLESDRLDMPVELAVEHVTEGRIDALKLIQKSAEEQGDLSVAMAAEFERREFEEANRSIPLRVVSWVFWHQIGGYLARPINPLVALLLASAIAVFIRWQSQPTTLDQGRRLTNAIEQMVKSGWGKKPNLGQSLDPGDLGPLVEWTVIKVLLAVFLIALARSTPTLRELIDSIA